MTDATRRKALRSKSNRRDPAWTPVSWRLSDVNAFKALARGDANVDQQRRALNWLMRAAGIDEQAFFSDQEGGDRETAFMLGRQYVGQQVSKMINMTADQMEQVRKVEDG